MGNETIETITRLLESMLDGTEDPDTSYKLRTALQLLELHRDNINRLQDAAEADGDLQERLRELGYLE